VAILTLGEGWHNNHHHYPTSARQGFYRWKIDLTYYWLIALEKVGLIWDLRAVPAHVLRAGLEPSESRDQNLSRRPEQPPPADSANLTLRPHSVP